MARITIEDLEPEKTDETEIEISGIRTEYLSPLNRLAAKRFLTTGGSSWENLFLGYLRDTFDKR